MKFQSHIVAILALGTMGVSVSHGSSPGGPAMGGQGYNNYQPNSHQGTNQRWDQSSQFGNYDRKEEPAVEAAQQDGLPDGWVEYKDPASGRSYYYNENDGTTTWDKPVAEPIEQAPEEPETEKHQADSEQVAASFDEAPLSDSHYHGYGMPQETDQEQPQEEIQPEPDPEPQQQTYEQPQQWQQQAPEIHRPPEQHPWGVPPQQREQQRDQLPPWGVQPSIAQQQGQQAAPWQKDPVEAPVDVEPVEEEKPVVEFSPPPQAYAQQQPPFQQPPFQQPPPLQEQMYRPPQQMQKPPFQQPPQQEQFQRPPQQQGTPFNQQQGPPVGRQVGSQQQQGPPPGYQRPPQQLGMPPPGQRSPWQEGPPQQHGLPPQQQQQPPYSQQYGQYGQQGNPYGTQHPGQYGQYGQQRPPLQPPQNQLIPAETTSAVKEALGKTWQGLLGFTNRTKEVVEQARDSVVSSATVAGQTIGSTTTGLWSQAKTGVGSLFEKSEGPQQPQGGYSMSGHYGPPPQQGGYPPQQYGGPPQYGGGSYPPPQYGQPKGTPPYPHQGQPQQQGPPLQAQWKGASPQQGGPQQGGPPPGQYQQYPPRGGPYGYPPGQQPPQGQRPPQGGPPVQRPPQAGQPASQPENWQHPGLGGDF